MQSCTTTPADRRRQLRLVGMDLLRHPGRRRCCAVQQVQDANLRQGERVDLACWAPAAFSTHADVDGRHRAIGESCEDLSMEGEMLSSASQAGDTSCFDPDRSWLEFPQRDLSLFELLDR